MKIGIVGLPNVGKSTLFNALTKQAAQARNVPFTTIQPNIGIVPVPDKRLDVLARISKSKNIVPTTIEFVDIAGLIRNAHKGEGLGNQFLANIREVDMIIHVVRHFEQSDVIHVDNEINPEQDRETIHTELALADLATVEKAIERNEKLAKSADKDAQMAMEVLTPLQKALAQGHPARSVRIDAEHVPYLRTLSLLTSKPMLFVANIGEDQLHSPPQSTNTQEHVIPLCIQIEQEIVELEGEEKDMFLQEYGLAETGLDRLIQESYKLLNLITFFTSGEQETRAWTVTQESRAPEAAGKIHSDMQRGFIRAETVSYDDLVQAGSYAQARAAGTVRDEGKEYIVQDGDVMLFKFSA